MTSFYYNNFTNSMEQDLIESLIVESISIYGHSVYYLPRTLVSKDAIFNEDRISKYKSAYDIDLYIKSYDAYQGDGTFLSKFNLEIRDQVTFVAARRSFRNYVTEYENLENPREGDLIYSPMMKRMFAITYVENQPIFYQMGSLQTWDLTCQMFEYSNERFETGIAEVDAIATKYSTDEVTDNQQFDDIIPDSQNLEFQRDGEDVLDWTYVDPFSEGNI